MLKSAKNAIGYFALNVLGPVSNPIYNVLRSYGREHMVLAFIMSIVIILVFVKAYKMFSTKIVGEEKKIIIFSLLFFAIALLPFLGLGNMSSRYSYLSSFGVVLLLVLFARRLYSYLLMYGKNIAVGIIVMISIIFFSIHLFQLQKIHSDWYHAGNISKKFLTSLNRLYTESYRQESVQFYFVDPPIRHGEAWVFPVGIEDALWFTFRNNNIAVNTRESLIPALQYALVSTTATRVFQFNKEGDGGFKEFNPAYLREMNK